MPVKPRKVAGDPGPAGGLDGRIGRGVDGPAVEHALAGGEPGRMPPPFGDAVDQCHVARDVPALQQRHPEMPGGVVAVVVLRRVQNAAAGAEAAEVHDRLGEDGEVRRHGAVRAGGQALAQRHLQLVEHPAVGGVPFPRLGIVGGDEQIRWTLHGIEILVAPGRRLDDRHVRGIRCSQVAQQHKSGAAILAAVVEPLPTLMASFGCDRFESRAIL